MFMPFFKTFIQIMLLRKGPQDVAYSRVMLGVLLIFVLALQFTAMLLPAATKNTAIQINVVVYVILSIGIGMGGVYLLLRWFAHPERLIQTLTAMIGVSVCFVVLRLLAASFLLVLGSKPVLSISLAWLLIAWELLIDAHILRHALSISLLAAGMVSYSFFLIDIMLAQHFGLLGN